MSRTNKVIKNSALNFSFSIVSIILSFISRKIFIDYLGDNLVGLNATMYNILGFLNLAESGISVSISFALYQPLYDKEFQKVKEIVSILKSLYKKVAYVMIGIAVILLFFLPLIFNGSGVSLVYVYATFIVFLISSLLGYFLNYRQILMTANQQEYVVVTTFKTCTILKVLFQIVALKYLNCGFFTWLGIELVFSFIHSYLLNLRIDKHFAWLEISYTDIALLREKYPFIIKKMKQVFFHQMAGFVLLQTSALFVYIFTDLSTVTKYTNYTLITSQASIFLASILNSSFASVGNLVAEGIKENTLKIFGELVTLRFLIAFVVVFCMYNLIEPFIILWLGPEYILDKIILKLILISMFIAIVRGCVDSFISAHGLFQDVWATCTEAAINIVTAIIAGYYWGLPGVALAPVVCTGIFVVFWKPYFLFKNGFQLSVLTYWKIILKICFPNGVLFLLCCIFAQKVDFEIDTFIDFFIYALILFISYFILSASISYISSRNIRDLTKHVINILKFKVISN